MALIRIGPDGRPLAPSTSTAPARTVTAPATWEGFNGSTPQGGHSEADILAAAIAYGKPRGLEPVYLKDNGQFLNGGYKIKFRDTKLGGVSTTEFVPMEGFSGYTLSGGGGGGGGGGGLVTTAIPGSAGYAQAAALAKRAYQEALARINQRRSSAGREFGYALEIDPESGVVKNLGVDPANSFGLLQQANQSQASRFEQARDAMIERGIRGGLAKAAERDVAFQAAEEDAKIAQALIDRLAGLQDEQTKAKYDMDKALYEAELQAAREALLNSLFNQASSGGGGGGDVYAEAGDDVGFFYNDETGQYEHHAPGMTAFSDLPPNQWQAAWEKAIADQQRNKIMLLK